MSLSIFFDPVPEEVYVPFLEDKDSCADHFRVYFERFPRWKRKDIALIGLKEVRGDTDLEGAEMAPDLIRQKLYGLKKGTGAYNIVDLGNLRLGPGPEDTRDRLSQVLETLLQEGVLPVLFGGSHDLDWGQYSAYESFGRLISVVTVDSHMDINPEEEALDSKSHTGKILTKKPNYLFSFNHLAYQTYFNSPEALATLEKLYFEAYSVGQMRDDFNEVEPVVRQADMLSFDIRSVKTLEAPGQAFTSVLGLTAEEACQLCWFSGLSEKLSSLGLYGFHPGFDERERTASLVATMIWYFLEGFYHRHDVQAFESSAYNKYVVSALDNSSNMVFYKHKRSQKWWMEVHYNNEISQKQENMVVPCSYKDYLTASRGEVPNRWINTYAKLV